MKFLSVAGVKASHAILIGDFGGGSSAVRSEHGLASALARPQNYLAYQDPEASLHILAALYGLGIARAHAFADGNKRTAWIAMYTFLGLHGITLEAADAEAIAVMGTVASGDMAEHELAQWLEDHTTTSPS